MQTPHQTRTVYQQCAVPGHQQENLNIICEDINCRNLLICCLCKYQKHQQHKTVLAKILISNLHQVILNKQENRSETAINNLLENSRLKQEQIVNDLKDLERKFSGAIEILVSKVKQQFRGFEEEAKRNAETVVDKEAVNQQMVSNIMRLHKFLTSQNHSEMDQYYNFMKKSTTGIESALAGWEQKLEYRKKGELEWAKHSSISIKNNSLTSTNTTTYKIAYIQSPLGNSERKFRVKIIQDTNNWMGIGVCHKKIIDSHECVFLHNSKAHGCYMINSNGSVWSNKEPELNSSVKSFKFKKGDIVEVVYEPQLKRLRFRKEGSKNVKDSYELKIEEGESSDLRFGMLFYYINDEMELLNDSLY